MFQEDLIRPRQLSAPGLDVCTKETKSASKIDTAKSKLGF